MPDASTVNTSANYASGPGLDDSRCRLLGPTALIVQALMGVMILLSLVYKRQREKPRRKWKIWMFDVSKQVLGQAILHGSNILVSWLIGQRTLKNPCSSYLMNILLDTTFGILIIYALLHLFQHLLTEKGHFEGFQSGVYGDPPSPLWWCKQAAVYFLTLLIMKTLVIVALELFPWLMTLGEWLLSWTGGKNSVQVVFVMGVFPIVMNIIQFWVIDSIVKFQATLVEIKPSLDVEDREPLVNGEGLPFEDEIHEAPQVDVRHTSPSDETEETLSRSGPSTKYPRPRRHPTTIFRTHGHTEDEDGLIEGAPPSPRTSTSTPSRTITVRPRSPPASPSPGLSGSRASSYDSMHTPAHSPTRNRWRSNSAEEDEDEHTKWGRSLSSSIIDGGDTVGDGKGVGAGSTVSDGGTSIAQRKGTSKSSNTRWESWRMPVITSPSQPNDSHNL